MIRLYLLLLSLVFLNDLQAQPLFTYGSEKVGKDEFLRAYNKNKTPEVNKEKALREYLELYINFKLKVKAAREMRLDTLPQLTTDLENFRQQVQENYMQDEVVMKKLQEEAFIRSQEDRRVMHISFKEDGDSVKGKMLAEKVFGILQGPITDPDEAINKLGDQGITARARDLGFITVFSVPYSMESLIYGLKKGELSKPYRSKGTWHFFRLLDQRPSAGKWKTAQILFSVPPGSSSETSAGISALADSIYSELKNGADFASMAKSYSEDKLTYQIGGEMTEFGTGKYEAEFEKNVFALRKDGDFTKPFRTVFGFHIVKRLSVTPTPSSSTDASLVYDLRQKLKSDARLNIAREKLADDLIKKINPKRNISVSDQELKSFADSARISTFNEEEGRHAFSKKNVFTLQKKSSSGDDWIRFVRQNNFPSDMALQEMLRKFSRQFVLDHYREHLEDYNEEFRFQMNEFREGNMLFESMERNVWSKASEDSAGLEKFYDANKGNYKWMESADMLIVNSISPESADLAMQAIKDGSDWHEIVDNNEGIQIDSGRYELSQIPAAAQDNRVGDGSFSKVIQNSDNSFGFVKLIKTYPAGQTRNFQDARGMVINDYQQVLEKIWISRLKKKYPVTVNEAVFQMTVKSL
jgi:peptidyl-prolyl cis-trans isomerase SurA